MNQRNGRKFRVKDMGITSGGPYIAIINYKDAQRLDIHSSDRVLLKHNSHKCLCIVDISETNKSVLPGRIGLFEEVLNKLKVKDKQLVGLRLMPKPESIQHIRDKLDGKTLNYPELYHITEDITNDRLTSIEKTYFVAASYTRGLSLGEVIHLTKAMVKTGKKIKFRGLTLDKHSIGGLPGNRTTMIIVPIVAAAGFTIPKTSSRAITSPAGTADAMECLAKVELSEKKIRNIVNKIGACIVHGGAMNLAPADDKIIEVEHPLSIDAEGQLIASVMAKKYSVSSNHVLIDIPMGETTKIKSLATAKSLKAKFEAVGRRLRMNVKVVITDGSQPIGNGIGPLLEAEDVMLVLQNHPLAPSDLREKALALAGQLLEMTGKYSSGRQKAEAVLKSGRALKKMQQIIKAQGQQPKPALGENRYQIRAGRSGSVAEIDNWTISKIAGLTGAPKDKGSGLYLAKHVGDLVKKGEVLYTIYAESVFNLKEAIKWSQKENGYKIA